MRRRVAADNHAGALAEAQRIEKPHRISRRLVGDDSPLERACLDLAEDCLDIREERRVHAERGIVVREEGIAQREIIGMIRRDAHSRADQSARAVRRRRAKMRRRNRRETPVDANAIQRRGEVGRRIGERAVEIEQDGVHGQCARGPGHLLRVSHRAAGATPACS